MLAFYFGWLLTLLFFFGWSVVSESIVLASEATWPPRIVESCEVGGCTPWEFGASSSMFVKVSKLSAESKQTREDSNSGGVPGEDIAARALALLGFPKERGIGSCTILGGDGYDDLSSQ